MQERDFEPDDLSPAAAADTSPPSSAVAAPAHDPYAALREGNFRRYLTGHFIAVLGAQMQTVAVLWEIYERTGSKAALGWVGVALFVPRALLVLVAGQLADHFDRRRVVAIGLALMAAGSLGLAVISAVRLDVTAMYACLLVAGAGSALQQPARSALVPQIVPRERFANAITWHTSGFQVAAMVGPALAGLLLHLTAGEHGPPRSATAASGWFSGNAAIVFLLDAVAVLTFLVLVTTLRTQAEPAPRQVVTRESLVAGIRYVCQRPVLLGAMTLDLFAVLLGGAATLFPVYAKDILAAGTLGLGWMQAAPAVGALAMLLVLAHQPPMERAGRELLWSVVGFGAATIAFGLSRNLCLTLVMLALTGAFDMVSVIVRHSLVQMLTPDPMRGRVSAVNSIFIGASNELGGAESGFVAALVGPVWTVVGGGIGTLLVAALADRRWPELRRHGRLEAPA